MAFRPALRLRGPAAAAAVAGAAMLYPRRAIFADAPPQDAVRAPTSSPSTLGNPGTTESQLPAKKPIYSDYTKTPTKPRPSSTSPAPPLSSASPTSPTPTDRLTAQVRRARLFLYDQSLAAENRINGFMTWALNKETSLANTISSLAPPPETGEQLLPGAIYVLVATMAGSIISRNRSVLVRATFPLAVGFTAAWVLIPVTMRNIADLTWEYEKRVPAIAETHAQVAGLAREAWRQTRVRTQALTRWADETAGESREKIEKWVSNGK